MKTDPDKRNKAKYCEFHKNHGHTTKNCIALQNEIEGLIRRGKLDMFLDGQNNGGAWQRSKSPCKPKDEKKRTHKDDQEDDTDLPKKTRQLDREVFMLSFRPFDYQMITGGDVGGGIIPLKEKLTSMRLKLVHTFNV